MKVSKAAFDRMVETCENPPPASEQLKKFVHSDANAHQPTESGREDAPPAAVARLLSEINEMADEGADTLWSVGLDVADWRVIGAALRLYGLRGDEQI